jgi:hydrogenase nickel insertion protein HypA
MHEYAITCSILKILKRVVKENKVNKLKKIDFEVSSITHIEPSSIKFYYEFLTRDDKILKDARLEFKKRNARIKCEDCGKVSEIKDLSSAECPRCSSRKVKLVDFDEIRIVSVEA